MALLADIATVLESAGVGTRAVSIFESMDPGQPTARTVLREYAGAPPIDAMGANAAKVERPRVQVLCCASNYDTAMTTALKAYDALHKKFGTIGSSPTKYLYIEALHSPYDMGLDESDRYYVSCNYEVTRIR